MSKLYLIPILLSLTLIQAQTMEMAYQEGGILLKRKRETPLSTSSQEKTDHYDKHKRNKVEIEKKDSLYLKNNNPPYLQEVTTACFKENSEDIQQPILKLIYQGEIRKEDVESLDFPSSLKVENLTTEAIYLLLLSSISKNYHPRELFFASKAHLQGISIETIHCSKDRDAIAFSNLARCYEQGIGTDFDFEQAAEYYQRAADGGFVIAQFTLGTWYEMGIWFEEDINKAISYYQLAASQGFIPALYKLSRCYEKRREVDKDEEQAFTFHELGKVREAIEYSQRAIERSLGAAEQSNLSEINDFTERDKDADKDLDFYCKAIAKKEANTSYALGNLYYSLGMINEDKKEATRLLKLSSHHGNLQAIIALGQRYRDGLGVEKDEKKAIALFLQVANRGNAEGQTLLAECYWNGIDGIPNKEAALYLYKLAEAKGNAKAQSHLGCCYQSGKGVPKDLSKAVDLFYKAAIQGDIVSQYYLARHYNLGIEATINQDKQKAVYWFLQAAAKNDRPAKSFLKELLLFRARASSSTPASISTEDQQNITNLSANLEDIRAQVLWMFSISNGNLPILADNTYLREKSQKAESLIDGYQALLRNINNPGFMVSCLKKSKNHPSFPIYEKNNFCLVGSEAVSLLEHEELYSSIKEIIDNFQICVNYLQKIAEEREVPFKKSIELIKFTLANSHDQNLYALFKDIFPDESLHDNEISVVLKNAHSTLLGVIEKSTVYMDFLKDLHHNIKGILKSTERYRNWLLISTVFIKGYKNTQEKPINPPPLK